MQLRSLIAAAAAAGGLLIAGNAFAAIGPFHAEAKLAGPAATATATIADASWSCQGDTCVGQADRRGSLDGPVRECKKVAAVLGPVAAYTTQGLKLQDGDLKVCNTAAAKSTLSATAK
jgi:hypothetical protein